MHNIFKFILILSIYSKTIWTAATIINNDNGYRLPPIIHPFMLTSYDYKNILDAQASFSLLELLTVFACVMIFWGFILIILVVLQKKGFKRQRELKKNMRDI